MNHQFLFSIFGVTIESYKEKFIPGFQNLDYCSDLSHHVTRRKIVLVWSRIVEITSPGLHAFCSHFRFFIPFSKKVLFVQPKMNDHFLLCETFPGLLNELLIFGFVTIESYKDKFISDLQNYPIPSLRPKEPLRKL